MAYYPGSNRSKSAVKRVRVRADALGDTQYIDANQLSVKSLAVKALNSLIGIFDPGKKREASRKARATFYGDLAVAGSITAARILMGGASGGQYQQYTTNEKGYYDAQVARLRTADPVLYAKAQQAGELPVPGDGDTPAGWQPSSETIDSFQREIDGYRNPGDASVTGQNPNAPKPVTMKASSGLLLPLVALGVLVGGKLFRRR